MIQNSFGNSPTVIVFKRFQHLGFKVGKMDFWGLRNGNGNFTILTKIHLGDTMILDILGNNPIISRPLSSEGCDRSPEFKVNGLNQHPQDIPMLYWQMLANHFAMPRSKFPTMENMQRMPLP
ncbi:uncharacterized protein LOC116180497 isoform X1 [Photinus pyralis]|uniref:uncharacterized protein LOC116180497 isoform X1 n=1 Tax=Photinus pyralis TaxID=7054 RepID=UPI00126756BE|nr:uncharacterized protein LOC116180497 isoform X1 [Photinus pyralis]